MKSNHSNYHSYYSNTPCLISGIPELLQVLHCVENTCGPDIVKVAIFLGDIQLANVRGRAERRGEEERAHQNMEHRLKKMTHRDDKKFYPHDNGVTVCSNYIR